MSHIIVNDIREAMAKAFFASSYADQYDEAASDGADMPFNPSGCDWMDLIPDDIDPAALHAARTLEFDLVHVNGCTLEQLYQRAEAIGPNGDREFCEDMIGHYLAMQAMGHGVGLYDAFGQAVYDAIKVPYIEFSGYSLERDYFDLPASEEE